MTKKGKDRVDLRPRVLLVEDDIRQRKDFAFKLQLQNHVRVAVPTKEQPDAIDEAPSISEAIRLWDPQVHRAVIIDLVLDSTDEEKRRFQHDYGITGKSDGELLAKYFQQQLTQRLGVAAAKDYPIFGMTLDPKGASPTTKEWFLHNAYPRREIGIYDKTTEFVTLQYHLFRALGIKDFKISVFIVHGHDTTWLREFEALAVQFGFEPKIVKKKVSKNESWFAEIEDEVNKSAIAWILHTPDDWGLPRKCLDKDAKPELRARPNVVFEHGWLFATFGQKTERVFVFQCGDVTLPSDCAALRLIQVPQLPISEEKKAEIRDQLSIWDPI